MKVKVSATGHLKTFIQEPIEVEVFEGCLVRDLLESLEVSRLNSLMITINDKKSTLDKQLNNGDEVKLIMIVGAG